MNDEAKKQAAQELTRRVERAIRRAVTRRARAALQRRTLAPAHGEHRPEELAGIEALAVRVEQLRNRIKIGKQEPRRVAVLRAERVGLMADLEVLRLRRRQRDARLARRGLRRDRARALADLAAEVYRELGLSKAPGRQSPADLAAITRAARIDRVPR